MKLLKMLLLVLPFFTCNAEITQVDDMAKVFDYFNEANANTLGVFDIDMVLTQPSDPAFQMANMKRFSSIAKKIMLKIPEDKRIAFLSLMSISSDLILIDNRTPHLLLQLAGKGIPAIALTANLTGEFASIKNMETWKIKHLRILGIDFSKNNFHKEQIIFKDLPSFRGNYSVYTEGIIFVNGTRCSKGEALLAFFEKIGAYPKEVIFVDDREENLKSVEASLQKVNRVIKFTGIHYVGAKQFLSEQISEGQFEARWSELAEQALTID